MIESSLVIIQNIGFSSNKAQQIKAVQSIKIPKFRLASDTVAIVHNCRSKNDNQITQYNNLVFAQPNNIGIKLKDNKLMIMPASNHPYGMQNDVVLDFGETIRIEETYLDKIHKTKGHSITNIAYCGKDFDSDIFHNLPTHHMIIGFTKEQLS